MSVQPPPTNTNGGFNQGDWTDPNAPVNQQYLAENYLQFPAAQGAETLATTTISGTLTAQDNATFSDVTFFNGDSTFSESVIINANTGKTNTCSINIPTTVTSTIGLGGSATATTQPSGNNTTSVATTEFVQNAVQVSGVQTTDTPLLWSGNNTWQTNIGNSGYTFPYGLNAGWNASAGSGDCDLIAIGGTTGNPLTGGLNVYLATAPTTITPATVPKFQVNANNVNIPAGSTYNINGVSITANSALLNGGTSGAPQIFTGYDLFENQTTFNGDNTTVQNTGIIKFTNANTGSIGTLYQDASGGNDMTLWSSNTNGGLTVRNPSYSFTVNPTLGNVATFTNPIASAYSITGGSFISSQTTLTQDPNFNPQIFSLTNTYDGTKTPQFYFQMQNTTNTAIINPMQITNTEVDINEDLNVKGTTSSNLKVYSPSSGALYTGIRTDGINSVFSNGNFNGTAYGTTYFQNADGSGVHNVMQINKDGVGVTYGGLGVFGGNLNVNSGNSSYYYDSSNTYNSLIQQNGANTIMRNNTGGNIYLQTNNGGNPCDVCSFSTGNGLTFYAPTNNTQTSFIQQQTTNFIISNQTSGGAVFIQTTPTGNTAYFNATGLTVLAGGVTVPALGTYPLANSNQVATITYVNQALATFGAPVVAYSVSQSNVTTFTIANGSGTTVYSYINANTAYQPVCTLSINTLGQKKIYWQATEISSGNKSYTFPFEISQPKITTNGSVNNAPTKIVLAYFDITSKYNTYNWQSSSNCIQNYTYSTSGGGAFSQATNFQTEIMIGVTTPYTYYLVLSLNTWSGGGGQGSNFNQSSNYYVTGQTIAWW